MLLREIKNISKDNLSNEECFRLFCFYSIGVVICPNSSGHVSKMYIPLLKDVKKLKHIAWGADMLVAFHYSIRSYFSLTKSQLYGPLLPFVVFLCKMNPDFAKMISLKEHFTPTEFPLMKQWIEKLHRALLNTHKEHKPKKEDYVKFFSEVKNEHVCKPRPSSYPRTREAANTCSCCDCTDTEHQYGGTKLSPHKSRAI
ncbi:hypothetical protein Hdeb2414_s0024g00650341 [Helianthus debilis subsp. tardiflorus]